VKVDYMPKKYVIVHDRDQCIGCGACAAVNPDNWEMAEDGLAKVKKTELTEEELSANMEAAESCPVNCIHIYEVTETGEKKQLI